MMTRVGQNRLLGALFKTRSTVVDAIAVSVEEMSNRKIGALIAIEANVGLRDFIETGVRIDSMLKSELILSLLRKESPLHDGALIIRDDRIVAAKCILPLTERHELLEGYGTRHLAALGLAEETDATVVVVSEATGKISLAFDGEIEMGISIKGLRERLNQILDMR
jgi:diadenylate cyclase